jgi:hypothetical protein
LTLARRPSPSQPLRGRAPPSPASAGEGFLLTVELNGGWYKHFFFEKKQKTFVPGHGIPMGDCEEIKVFCFFSSEKKILAYFGSRYGHGYLGD